VKIFGKAIILLFLVTVLLTSCNDFTATPVMRIASIETPAPIPTATFTAIPLSSPSLLPSTETSIPIIQNSPIPVSGTPTTVIMENGFTWTECVLPSQDYAHSAPDIEFVTNCLKMELPIWDDNDRKMAGERLKGEVGDNLRQIIDNDIYETRYTLTNGRNYELLKNGEVIANVNADFITFDPNRNLWNIGGRLVWEVADPFVIIIDGINQNDKYQLEASHFPYEIQNKLIYIARKNRKFSIIYDDKVVGPEFDEIYRAYCCGTTKVRYGQGQYWFWGKREGTYYVVAIH
jgi:hypothetical protein